MLETLKLQPLTEEEKARRHILGRWYGPIATCNESTRNGRRYNRELWEKALNDELFHEKIANKCLFLELGHPADREETDMSKVCACIPEMPKIINGDLCACVDILDTPNGRILKALCDYGFIPGVSSRGSGDVMPNDEVDPETFFLECFDVVAIPALKKARLNMCESLDKNAVKLKKALTESFHEASDEDKAIMKETLDNLNIDIEETSTEVLTDDDIPWAADEEEILTEEMPADEETEEVKETEAVEENSAESSEAIEEIAEETAEKADETVDEVDVEETDEASEETAPDEAIVDVTGTDEADLDTVKDAIELLQEFDEDTRVEFELTQPNGEEVPVDCIEHFFDDEVLVLNVKACESEEDSDSADSNIETDVEESPVETIEEVEDDEDSADDDGDVEVIESLKEMVRQKEALENEVNLLRKAKTVGDAEVKELQEKLNRYRTAFRNTSAEAAKVPELQTQVQKLTEQLAQSNKTINTLTEQVNKAKQLKESIEGSKTKERSLTEEVSRLTKHSKTLEAKLEGQSKVYTEKLNERTNLAKAYKTRYVETLTKYIESKASMLGVAPSEITSRLNESYTLADIDTVCNQILNNAVPFSRLPFSGRAKTSARIAESVSRPARKDPEYGYDIDDSLYELAGLKK